MGLFLYDRNLHHKRVKILSMLTKSSMMYVCHGPKYASEIFWEISLKLYSLSGDVFRTQWNIYDEAFCVNS